MVQSSTTNSDFLKMVDDISTSPNGHSNHFHFCASARLTVIPTRTVGVSMEQHPLEILTQKEMPRLAAWFTKGELIVEMLEDKLMASLDFPPHSTVYTKLFKWESSKSVGAMNNGIASSDMNRLTNAKFMTIWISATPRWIITFLASRWPISHLNYSVILRDTTQIRNINTTQKRHSTLSSVSRENPTARCLFCQHQSDVIYA